MKFRLLFLLIIALLLFQCQSQDKGLTELRGVWLTNVDSHVLDSRANIAEAMQFLADHHFNIVYPVVWNNAQTLYPSQVMQNRFGQKINPKFTGRDPLAEVIEEAHQRGIAVIPWFEYGFASSYNKNGGTIIEKYPHWAAKDAAGNLLNKNGFEWLNAYHPEVQAFLKDLIMEVVKNYDIDGIQGDDRMPANPVEGGYSEVTQKLYVEQHNGALPPQDCHNDEWIQWRADILSNFARNIYNSVKKEKPNIQISWAPSIFPWSKEEYLQDWPNWYKQGAGDFFHPQVYRYSFSAYKKAFNTLSESNLNIKNPGSVIFPGVLINIGKWIIKPDTLLSIVNYNREMGFSGEVFFFYEGLRKNNNQLADTLLATYYKKPAMLPFPPQFQQ